MDQSTVDSMVNIQQLCRLCGSKTETKNRLNIFDISNSTLNLQIKIKSCIGLEICVHDILPKFVCLFCASNVENFSIFKATCEKTADLFSSLCNQQITLNRNLVCKQTSSSGAPSPPPLMTEFVEPEREFMHSDFNCLEPIVKIEVLPEKAVNTDPISSKKRVENSNPSNLTEVISKNLADCLKKNNNKPVIKLNKSTIIYTCDLCSKIFNSKESILKHMSNKHFPSKVPCQLCNKKFKDKYTLKCHIKNYHDRKITCVCVYCGKGFVSKTPLDIHVRSHHTNERPFECTQCDKKFTTISILKSHVSTVHNDGSVQWVCDICNKPFKNKYYLSAHKKIHAIPIDERKKVQCIVCNARFRSECEMKHHMRKHTGEKPFECNLCSNRYASSKCLKEHMLTHTGERKHICEVCGSAFALLGNLKMHRLTVHEGIKKFKCKDCGKSYTQHKNLNIHLRKTGHTRLKC